MDRILHFLADSQRFVIAVFLTFSFMSQTHALSEIKREDLPPPAQNGAAGNVEAKPDTVTPIEPVPLPGEEILSEDPSEPDVNADPDQMNGDNVPATQNDIPVPDILRDVSALPKPVQRMRELIMEACRTGDVEKLRPLIGTGNDITTLSFGGIDGDPIEFLKGTSGDGEGHEILAILLEVLEAGFVRMDKNSAQELYVWPYFYATPLDKLTPPQKVELFELVTAGDYEDMKSFGAYIFYRVGITPEGRWSFFVAGD